MAVSAFASVWRANESRSSALEDGVRINLVRRSNRCGCKSPLALRSPEKCRVDLRSPAVDERVMLVVSHSCGYFHNACISLCVAAALAIMQHLDYTA